MTYGRQVFNRSENYEDKFWPTYLPIHFYSFNLEVFMREKDTILNHHSKIHYGRLSLHYRLLICNCTWLYEKNNWKVIYLHKRICNGFENQWIINHFNLKDIVKWNMKTNEVIKYFNINFTNTLKSLFIRMVLSLFMEQFF